MEQNVQTTNRLMVLNRKGFLDLTDNMNDIDFMFETEGEKLNLNSILHSRLGEDVKIVVKNGKTLERYFVYEGMLYKSKDMFMGDYFIGENNLINALWSLTKQELIIEFSTKEERVDF